MLHVTTSTPQIADRPCSDWSLDLAEPLAGTASPTRGYLVIEQSGAWGRQALTESSLDTGVAEDLGRRLDQAGLSPLLIRRPGRSPDRDHREGRQVFAAALGDDPAAVSFRVTDLAELLDLDWSAFTTDGLGRVHPEATPLDAPLALVCAHAKRDRCCAAKGRPLAAYLDQHLRTQPPTTPQASSPAAVWECSHLGGHRLAPTALLLPLGVVYGRLDPESLLRTYEAARDGQVVPPLMRGLARYPRAVQAAEIAVRTRVLTDSGTGETVTDGAAPRLLDQEEVGWTTTARFVDHRGQRWSVQVTEEPVAQARPESCGKAPAQPTVCTVDRVRRHGQPRIEP